MPLADDAKSRTNPFFTWDIETSKWVNLVVIGLYAPKIGFKYFKTFPKFFEFILTYLDGYDGFAHFAGRFDHLFLIRACLECDGVQITQMIPRGSGIYLVEVEFDGEMTFSFYDSSALLPFALKRVTKEFNVTHQKGEIDYEKITKITPELLTYLESDCVGLYESLEKLFSWPLIKKAGPAKSLASQSLRVLRTTLKKPIAALSRSWDQRIRRAYAGGRTEIFRCTFESMGEGHRLKCYDVNSLYPYVMRENEYPNTVDYETDEFEKDKPGFWECEVDVPRDMHIPPIGVVHNKKYIFPTGCFEATLTTEEVNYARRSGCNIKVREGVVFSNAGYVFREFVDTLYRIRESCDRGSVDSTVAKLLLNSCYGRFGLNHEKSKIVFDDGRTGLRMLGGRETIIRANDKNYRLMEESVELDSFSNVAIAAYVTANARIHMHRILRECGEDAYYTDTDSIFTTRDLPTGTGLGQLKLEYECESACFLLPKTYIADKKVVMKGFDKKKISGFTYEDFYECLRGDLGRLKIKQEPKFATFKTAVRLGELVTMTKASTRQIRSLYDKRVVLRGNEYKTKPIRIGENHANSQ